jgi:CRP-like cAMP-binding protein
VFGVLEGLMMAATALGAISVPILVAIVGSTGVLVAIGLFLPVVALALGRAVATGDRVRLAVGPELALLRGLPMFAPLPAPELERLAGALQLLHVPVGRTIVRQGEPGDRFFVVTRGFVEVTVDGRLVRRQGPGEGFGEIALLREVPRTATVTAATDVQLGVLDRDAFLAALAGHRASRPAAERLADDRLRAAEGDA